MYSPYKKSVNLFRAFSNHENEKLKEKGIKVIKKYEKLKDDNEFLAALYVIKQRKLIYKKFKNDLETIQYLEGLSN